MAVLISGVEVRSPAERAGVCAGDVLVSLNGHAVNDVLDYRFYLQETKLSLLLRRGGQQIAVSVKKDEFDDLGLLFDTYLMDKQHTCKNKCVFCFVDQMPKNMRESLYFKDDDSRMSFLFGNYITLTNMTRQDIQRIIDMRISPINVSVHTTDPKLRVKLMKNPHAADSLDYLNMLTNAGIRINTQLVLMPGLNDGQALRKTLSDLAALGEYLQSIACVPVGLTKHRTNLPRLKCFDETTAAAVIDLTEAFGEKMRKERGDRVAFAADEFYLLAKRPIPPASFYGDFNQLENGVGLIALLHEEFWQELESDEAAVTEPTELSVATGTAAYGLISTLAKFVEDKHPSVKIHVYPILNDFFGHTITVAGLVTGTDILRQLADKPLGSRLLIPSVMLRHEKDRFLDDVTPEQLESRLHVPVTAVDNDGAVLYHAMCGRFQGA